MTTTIDTEKVMHQTVYTHLAENVWNTPLLECRRNIVLQYHNKGRAAVNTVDLGCQSVDLPYRNNLETKKSFYIYSAAKCCMGGLIVDTEVPSIKQSLANYYDSEWIPLDVYLNHRPFDLRIHGIHGEWLYRNEIYIRNHPYQNMFLIAIEMKMAQQILGDSYDFKKIFMSVYYDSDNDLNNLSITSKTIQCFHPSNGNTDALNEAYEAFASLSTEVPNGKFVSERDQAICFIDGREAQPASLKDLKFDQYVEIVKDPDIIYNIVMDLTKVGKNNIYRSPIDDTYKYIVHIPKEVNPNNYIITHNTCDLFIRPINSNISSDERLKGLFIHRFDTSIKYAYAFKHIFANNSSQIIYIKTPVPSEDTSVYSDKNLFIKLPGSYTFGNSEYVVYNELKYYREKHLDNPQLIDYMITQITHNDFGVSEKLLTSRMETDIFSSSECVLRAVIRRHSKTKVLSEDANFINLLYNFNNDEQILKILTGYEDKSLDFWRAENLEQSNFAKMLVNFPILTNSSNTQYYMDALGYFNSLCILTPRVMRRTISDTNTRSFDVSIPVSMLSCDRIGLLIYLNNKKINEGECAQYSRDPRYQYIHVTLDNSVELSVGDKIAFELFDNSTFYGEYFTPTNDNNIFWLSEGIDYEIYKVIDEDPVSDYYSDHYPDLYQEHHPNEEYDCHASYIHINDNDEMERIIEGNPISGTVTIVNGNETTTIKKIGLVFNSSTFETRFFICSKVLFKRFTKEDIADVGGNVTIGGVDYGVGTCTDLMHSGYLKIKSEKFRWNMVLTRDTKFIENKSYYTLNGSTYTRDLNITAGSHIPNNTYYEESKGSATIPIINKEWNAIVFMNNKELARDIDFTFHPITSMNGVKGMVLFFNNISYLYSNNNTFEVYITSDKEFMNFSGFMHNRYAYAANNSKIFRQGVVEDIAPYVYWFNRLCTSSIDGNSRLDLGRSNGYLKIFKECRQGALYYMRGMIPVETQQFVDKYLNIDDDLTKLSAIAEYRKLHSPAIPPEIEVIPYSHHIASITMNAVVKDVLTGAKILAYESDPYMMLRQLTEYESLKKYDAAMNGVAKEISIRGCGYARVNNNYKLVDPSMVGYHRRWKNAFTNIIIYCDYNSEAETYTWKIAAVNMLGIKVYYYANDPTGTNDPWELTWELALDTLGNPIDTNEQIPIIESGCIDLRYLDLFPSYSSDLHFVVKDVVLKQAMRALFPIDDVKDGDTVS